MVSNLFFYQLALITLLWLCLLLHYAWPSDRAAIRPTPSALTPPRRKRHRALKSFEGLATKPPCDACEHTKWSFKKVFKFWGIPWYPLSERRAYGKETHRGHTNPDEHESLSTYVAHGHKSAREIN